MKLLIQPLKYIIRFVLKTFRPFNLTSLYFGTDERFFCDRARLFCALELLIQITEETSILSLNYFRRAHVPDSEGAFHDGLVSQPASEILVQHHHAPVHLRVPERGNCRFQDCLHQKVSLFKLLNMPMA